MSSTKTDITVKTNKQPFKDNDYVPLYRAEKAKASHTNKFSSQKAILVAEMDYMQECEANSWNLAYYDIENQQSQLPGGKICDVTGLPTEYYDRRLRMYYYNHDIYKALYELSEESKRRLTRYRTFEIQ